MFIHPEMKELLNEEMREGLAWWRKTATPEEIKARVDKRMVIAQKAIITGKDLVAKKVWDCNCITYCIGHTPWCEQTYRIVFETEKPVEWKSTKDIDGRDFYSGHWTNRGLP